jgi:ABC-type branched-subunit amino acid transport system substrate-binding protein
VVAACSVSTPRNGFSEVRAGSGVGPTTGAGTATGPTAGPGTGDAGGVTTGATTADEIAAGASSGGSGSTGGAVATGATPDGGQVATATLASGVTSKTITVSAIAGFSGNYGAILSKIYENGYLVWANDVNERGGINGRQVVMKKIDNKDTSEGGVAACKEVQNNGSAFAVNIVGFGGADVSAADCLSRAGITTLAFNLSSFSPAWKTVYSAGDAGKQTRPMASFIKNVLGEKEKVAVIHTRDPLNAAARAALVDQIPKEGLKVVHEEAVAPSQGSFVAELNRTRASGAGAVALLVNTAEVLGLLRDAKALGYAPKWTGNYWPTDENTAAARPLFEGIKVLRNYASVNSPAFADYKAKANKQGRNDVVNSTTMALYAMGLTTGQIISNAGANPAPGSFNGAIEQIVNYDNQIGMTLSFGRGVHVAEVGMWPIQCCNGDNTWRGIGGPASRF